jgi:rare lipoprotein A
MGQRIIACLALIITLSACSSVELGSHVAKNVPFPSDAHKKVGDFKVGNPYKIKGRTYYPAEKYRYSETGMASWYGPGFHGKLTANGEIFNKHELTAAHRTLQMPSIVRVTNLDNGRSIILRVNDRGPFSHGRILDVSEKAAEVLGFKRAGTARVRVDVLEKESRKVANAARNGLSTRGSELAFNRGKSLPHMQAEIARPVSKPVRLANRQRAPIERVALVTSQSQNPIVKPISQPLYIQAGLFRDEDSAMTMKMGLYNIQQPVTIHRTRERLGDIYKVQIGPILSVAKANEILTMLNRKGRNARITTLRY